MVVISTNLNSYYSDKFYELFRDMNPLEICSFLENYFWNKQKFWLKDYIKNRDYYLDLVNDKKI